MGLMCRDRGTQAFTNSNENVWFTMSTQGSNFRPTVEGPRRRASNYMHWSPQEPDTYFDTGLTSLGSPVSNDSMYKVAVAENGVTSLTAVLTSLPADAMLLSKMISSDGKRVLLQDVNASPSFQLYPTTMFPAASETLDIALGYSVDRDFIRTDGDTYGQTYAAGTPLNRYHDSYFPGLGDEFFLLPSGSATWWRVDTEGSAVDGGAIFTDPVGDVFGEEWPENHRSDLSSSPVNSIASPFVNLSGDYNVADTTSAYWSHPAYDRWNRVVLFSNSLSLLPNGIGPGTWDYDAHAYIEPSFGNGAQHHCFAGFSDWCVSSTLDASEDYSTQRIVAQKFDDDTTQFEVANPFTRHFGGTVYNSLAKPFNSPDGTKVAYMSEYLNIANKSDSFWSVVMYPRPPTDLAASGTGQVDVEFLPATYTARKWINAGVINEATGETLYAREVKNYRLWRAAAQSGTWTEITSQSAEYENDSTTNTLRAKATSGAADWVTGANKISVTDTPSDGTWYYALTSQEHCDLESDFLSEIIEVTVAGGNVTGTSIVEVEGQVDFWVTAPSVPTVFTAVGQATDGHYQLDWTEPADAKIRYYNVYYGAGSVPTKTVQFRIASIPVGVNSWLDWNAHHTETGNYRVTSVDRYGNESALVAP